MGSCRHSQLGALNPGFYLGILAHVLRPYGGHDRSKRDAGSHAVADLRLEPTRHNKRDTGSSETLRA